MTGITPAMLAPAVVTGNVADPHWYWWIIFYFFLGGIAGGAYLTAAVSDLVAPRENRAVAHAGYLLALPLIAVCGLLLTLDLGRPGRFWHMLWNVTTNEPAFKYWAPISYGSWLLTGIGGFSFLSVLLVLAEGRGMLTGLREGPIGKAIAALGALVAMLFVSYTGALLNATNQRIWGDNSLLGPLFAASGISTGIAAIVLIVAFGRRGGEGVLHRLERADLLALAAELLLIVVLVAWLASGNVAGPLIGGGRGGEGVLHRLERADLIAMAVELLLIVVLVAWLASEHVAGPLIGGAVGIGLWVGVVLLGLLVPLALYLRPRLLGALTPVVASILALLGGLILRWAILMAAHA
jgi:formate-dependent nitrite reductase membrane component NrfD